VLLLRSSGAAVADRGIGVIGGLVCVVNDDIVSVTLLAAFIKLPQTPPLVDPDGAISFSSLFEADMVLLILDQERWCDKVALVDLSEVDVADGGFIGVAGVTDMAGTDV
jgi:hypothetical protein